MRDDELIIGEKVFNIKFLTYQENTKHFEIEKILIAFKTHYLLLEVDVEHDEVIPRVVRDTSMFVECSEKKIKDVSEGSMKEYECIINSKLIWFWEMTNNQGYLDGIQLEFENNIIFQFLVECSFFRNSKLERI